MSRTRYYQWCNLADREGLDALMPEGRRSHHSGRPRAGDRHANFHDQRDNLPGAGRHLLTVVLD